MTISTNKNNWCTFKELTETFTEKLAENSRSFKELVENFRTTNEEILGRIVKVQDKQKNITSEVIGLKSNVNEGRKRRTDICHFRRSRHGRRIKQRKLVNVNKVKF